MLSAVTDTKGAAGYVAIESITGVLQGRQGSFVVQHAGTMADGKQELSIVIVPHSGTGQLEGYQRHDGHPHRGRAAFLRSQLQLAGGRIRAWRTQQLLWCRW